MSIRSAKRGSVGTPRDENGLQPSDGHVKAIRALVEPASGDELMMFLRLVNDFSDFVDHFADSAQPLYSVLKGTDFSKRRRRGQKFVIQDWDRRWGEAQRIAWKELKDSLSRPETLAASRRGAQKKTMTDASAYGLGGVFLQKEDNGKWRPIAFTSKTLKKSELSYTVTENLEAVPLRGEGFGSVGPPCIEVAAEFEGPPRTSCKLGSGVHGVRLQSLLSEGKRPSGARCSQPRCGSESRYVKIATIPFRRSRSRTARGMPRNGFA